MAIEGVVDDLIGLDQLRGWARYTGQHADDPVSIEVLHNGRLIASGQSGLSRSDVSGNFGFSITIHAPISGDDLLSGALKVYALAKIGTRIELPLYSRFQDELRRLGYSQFRTKSVRNPFCIYTSAGDRSNIASWFDPNQCRSWDLIVSFYGDDDTEFDKICSVANYATRQKGGKYPNLKKLLSELPGIIDGYQYIWVMDDDIIIDPSDIIKCFRIARWFDLPLCAPSFNPVGKVSFDITRKGDAGDDLRYVSFVENTCPIFEAGALQKFLRAYDGTLVSGFGVDYLYCHVLETEKLGRAAIIDAISVINPHDHQKPRGGPREILRLTAAEEISTPWQSLQYRAHIPAVQLKTFASVKFVSDDVIGHD